MSFNPEKLTNLQAYLDIINVFLRDVPIQDVKVPGARSEKETWEQFRLDALQAMDITRFVLAGNQVRDPCPGKIIRRYIEVNPLKLK